MVSRLLRRNAGALACTTRPAKHRLIEIFNDNRLLQCLRIFTILPLFYANEVKSVISEVDVASDLPPDLLPDLPPDLPPESPPESPRR